MTLTSGIDASCKLRSFSSNSPTRYKLLTNSAFAHHIAWLLAVFCITAAQGMTANPVSAHQRKLGTGQPGAIKIQAQRLLLRMPCPFSSRVNHQGARSYASENANSYVLTSKKRYWHERRGDAERQTWQKLRELSTQLMRYADFA